MKTKMLLTAGLVLAGSFLPALAADPIYVVRPSMGQGKAAVLPQSAFSSTTTPVTPTNPTPSPSGYAFTSGPWSQSPWTDAEAVNRNVPVNGTVSLSSGNRYEATFLPNGFCDIAESASSDSVKKRDVMYVPDMSSGSRQERYVQPTVTGKLAIVFFCDSVNNLPGSNPGSRFYGKLLLTVTP
jgi:hypothetical protein